MGVKVFLLVNAKKESENLAVVHYLVNFAVINKIKTYEKYLQENSFFNDAPSDGRGGVLMPAD